MPNLTTFCQILFVFLLFALQNSFSFSVLPPQYFNPFYLFFILLFCCFRGYYWFFSLKRLVFSDFYPLSILPFSKHFLPNLALFELFCFGFWLFHMNDFLVALNGCTYEHSPPVEPFVRGLWGVSLRKCFVLRFIFSFFSFFCRR